MSPIILGSFADHVWRDDGPDHRRCIYCPAEMSRGKDGTTYMYGGHFTTRDIIGFRKGTGPIAIGPRKERT